MIDKNGVIKYSEILKVKLQTLSFDIQITPNPVQGNTVTLTIGVAKTKQLAITIFNVQGQKVYEQKVQAISGTPCDVPVPSKVIFIEHKSKPHFS